VGLWKASVLSFAVHLLLPEAGLDGDLAAAANSFPPPPPRNAAVRSVLAFLAEAQDPEALWELRISGAALNRLLQAVLLEESLCARFEWPPRAEVALGGLLGGAAEGSAADVLSSLLLLRCNPCLQLLR